MRRRLIHLLILLAALALSLFVFALLGRSYLEEVVRMQFTEEIGRRTGLTLRMDRIGGNPLSGLRAEGVEAFSPSGARFRAEEITLSYRLPDLLASPPRIRSLRVLRPELRLSPTQKGGGKGRKERERRGVEAPFLVEHFAVDGGTLEGGPVPATSIEADGAIRDGEGGILVELARLSARVEAPGGEEKEARLAGSFLVRADGCSCEAEGNVGDSRFRESGSIFFEPVLSGRGTLVFDPLSLEEALPLIGRSRAVERGEARVEIRFAGTRDSLDLAVESRGVLNTLEWEDLRADGSVRGSFIELRSFSGSLNGSDLSGTGRFDLSAGGESRLTAAFERLDVSRFGGALGGGRPTDLNGTIRWSGAGRDLTNLEGRFSMRVGRSRFGNVTIRDARVEGRAEGDILRIEESAIRTASSDLRFSGRIGFDGTFLGDLDATLPSLAEFRPATGIDSLDGSARLLLSVEGEADRIAASGEAVVERGRVERFRAERLFLEGWFERKGEELRGESAVRSGRAEINGNGVDSLRLGLALRNRRLRIEDLHAWREGWRLQGVGAVDWAGPRREVRLRGLKLYEGDSLAVEAERVEGWWDGEGYGISPLRFSYGGGSFLLDGESQDGDSLRFRLQVEGADLTRAAPLAGLPPDLLGRVDLEAAIRGRRGARIGDLRFDTRRREDSAFPFRGAGGSLFVLGSQVHLDSLVLAGEREGARIRASGVFPIDPAETPEEEIAGTVEVSDYPLEDLRYFLESLDEVEGKLDGVATVGGSWAAPVIAASAAGDALTLRGYPVGKVRADSIRAAGDSLSFVIRLDPYWGEENRIAGRIPFRLAPGGEGAVFPEEGPVRLDVHMPDGDIALPALFAGSLEEGMGGFSLDARLTGDLSDPRLDGVLEIRDGLFFLAGSSVFFDRVEARLLLDEKRINLVRFRARSGERGSLYAWGTIDLEDFRPAVYDIGFKARRYDMLLAEGVQVTFDGDLSLRPDTTLFRKVVPHISGEADIRGALIERELSVEEGGNGEGSVFDPTGDPGWTMDIFLRAPQNFWIRNRTADLELGGEAQIRRSSEGLGALGSLEVLRGRYWLYNNEFRIIEGNVTFVDPADLRTANVDLTARTDVMDERIEIRLVREDGEMQVLPTSESGYSEGEILSILTLRAHPQDDVNSGEILSSWFATFANRLSREMSRGLGDIGVIEIGTSEELPEIRYGNYLSSDLYVGFSQKLRTEDERGQERSPTRENLPIPERQVRVEYRLRRSLVIQGEVGTLSDGDRFLNLDLRVRLPY